MNCPFNGIVRLESMLFNDVIHLGMFLVGFTGCRPITLLFKGCFQCYLILVNITYGTGMCIYHALRVSPSLCAPGRKAYLCAKALTAHTSGKDNTCIWKEPHSAVIAVSDHFFAQLQFGCFGREDIPFLCTKSTSEMTGTDYPSDCRFALHIISMVLFLLEVMEIVTH